LEKLFSRQNKINISLEKPHRVEFYHIIFIQKGDGTHFIDFRSYNYNTGDVLFVSKGQIQAFEINPEVKGFIMLFTPTFLSKNLIHSDIISL
jgi:quercetin dioxygenase-like cupin family protein